MSTVAFSAPCRRLQQAPIGDLANVFIEGPGAEAFNPDVASTGNECQQSFVARVIDFI